MLDLSCRLPIYWAARQLGWGQPLPVNLTLSLTYRCNSRCATCNAWRRHKPARQEITAQELTLDEWDRVLRSLGHAPWWITLSGGEPLLRPDVVEIARLVDRHCRPSILNIPTNGLLPERTARYVKAIAEVCAQSSVVVNLSLDGWGEAHNRIRGVPGSFERAIETYYRLRALQAPNLTLGVHTVVSRFNAGAVPGLYARVQSRLAPDSYITEIAEERVELGTIGCDITPAAHEYQQAIEQLLALQAQHPPAGLGKVAWTFRRRYYRLVQRWLAERQQAIPCYAGWASAQVSPEGDVWFCCTRAHSVGNLREAGYDFRAVWWGEQAQALRAEVRAGRCACPLANAAYTNLLFHLPSLASAAWDFVRGGTQP